MTQQFPTPSSYSLWGKHYWGVLKHHSFIPISHQAVVHLQLHTGVSVCFLSTWKDFTDHIAMTTKAVAEAPFKWACPLQLHVAGCVSDPASHFCSPLCDFRREREKTNFSFYLESDWAGGHRVDKAGKGLLQVWKRQIQQLNRVSPDMASAILTAYPSPQLLNKVCPNLPVDQYVNHLLSQNILIIIHLKMFDIML